MEKTEPEAGKLWQKTNMKLLHAVSLPAIHIDSHQFLEMQIIPG